MNTLRTCFGIFISSLAFAAACSSTSATPDGGTAGDDSGPGHDATTGDGSGDAVATDSAGDSASCNDNAGSGLDCPEAGGFVDAACGTASSDCALLANAFKPKVAHAAQNCLLGLNDMCDGNQTAMCVENAAGAACDDPGAMTMCQEAAATCGDAGDDGGAKFTVAECYALAKGLTSGAQTNYKNCLSACGQGLHSCFVFFYQI